MGSTICCVHGLHAREWDGEYVIYNDNSDQTHLIGGAAARIFARLTMHSCDRRQLASSIADDGTAPDEIESAIDHLVELGLVEAQP